MIKFKMKRFCRFDRWFTGFDFSHGLPLLRSCALPGLFLFMLFFIVFVPVEAARTDSLNSSTAVEVKKEETSKETETGKKEIKKQKEENQTPNKDKTNIEDPGQEQLKPFLQAARQLKKLNTLTGPGHNRKIIKRRASRFLQKAASISTDASLKQYLEALAGDIKKNNFKDSTALWLNRANHQVDIIVFPIAIAKEKEKSTGTTKPEQDEKKILSPPTRRQLAIYVLEEDSASTAKTKQYSAVLDKMMENLQFREKLALLDMQHISPVIVTNVKFSYPVQPDRYAQVLPVSMSKGTPTKFKIMIFRNILESYFQKEILPLADKVLAPRWAKQVDFDSYLSNLVMHRLAHFSGPVFLDQKSDRAVLAKSVMKETYFATEEILADTAGIFNTKVLIEEKLISKEQEENIYATHLVNLIKKISSDPGELIKKTTYIQLNHLLKSDGISYDINQKVFKIDNKLFASSAKRLMTMTSQYESTGDENNAKSLLNGSLSKDSIEIGEILKKLKQGKPHQPGKKSKAKKAKKKNTPKKIT